MLALRLLDFLNLDGYRNLWDKFHDPHREDLRWMRQLAYANYKYYKQMAFSQCNFKYMSVMWKAKRNGDYELLYNMQMALEGDPEAERVAYWAVRDK